MKSLIKEEMQVRIQVNEMGKKIRNEEKVNEKEK